MANNKIAMRSELYQNTNSENNGYGKYYARPVIKDTLNLKGFARHIHQHTGAYRTSVIKGVMEEMVDCMVEMISQGVGVKLDGLGTFYPTFECEGADSEKDFNIQECLKGIHIRFQPEGAKDEELTSRKFKDKVTLRLDKDDESTQSQGGNSGGTVVENP